jgi:hypothetical protein
MRVFFTTPFSGKHDFQPFIDEIIKVLRRSKAIIISPEMSQLYAKSIQEYELSGLQFSKAHYAFVTNAIAEADLVIIEASHESLRVGHEATLALIYGKPTLILSQNKNYAHYISHELLMGVQYKTKHELRDIVRRFLVAAQAHLSSGATQSLQAIESAVDSLRLTTFATMRQQALQDDGEFGAIAQLAEQDPNKAYERVQFLFGTLPVERAWSVFSSIYDEDTPPFVFTGAIRFITSVLKEHGIQETDSVVDVFTHAGMIARQLLEGGYSNLIATNEYREMVARTYQVCARNPEIKIIEASPETLQLATPAKAMIWIDYTTNFALTEKDLQHQLQNLIDNLAPDGCFIFDVRTIVGWKAYLFTEKIATFAAPRFQRISANTLDYKERRIHFDRFIRIRQSDGLFGEWRREQMTDRMWSLTEVKAVIARLRHVRLEAIYSDSFAKLDLASDEDPGVVYFVLKKKAA